MKRTKMQKGITLIALIITIIILLILAVVTIGSIKNSNIITYAQNASTDYEKAKNDEEGIISNYESIIKENLPGGEKVTYIGDVPIPAGFYYVTGKKDTGLVISDSKLDEENLEEKDGNQFVWVPVPNIGEFARKYDDSNYQGVLYDFSGATATEKTGYGIGTTSYREPGVVTKVYNSETGSKDKDGADMDPKYLEKTGLTTDLTGDNKIDEKDFEYQLQKEFNEMVASVAKYKGFYVGRYETSLDETKPQSKASTPEKTIKSVTAEDNNNTWYGLYKLNKEYTTSSVKSSMIWGSQYDAMMRWMELTDLSSVPGYNTSQNPGTDPLDVIRNVYDLYGNRWEWTLEAHNTCGRVLRGGAYDCGGSPSSRLNDSPIYTNSYHGSRLTLYIV